MVWIGPIYRINFSMPNSSDLRQADEQPLLAQALASAANAIFITDVGGKIVWVNDAFSRLSGYKPHDTIGRTPAILRSGSQNNAFYTRLWQTILAGEIWQGDVIDKRKDGTLYTADEVITPLFNEQGSITHFLAIQHDITLRKHECVKEHYLAYHDMLTGLSNRANFLRIHQNAIEEAKTSRHMLATLFLDLDNFKPINDRFGHHVGDQLLIAFAERLRSAVRKADIVARFGGDEFAILLTDIPDTEVASELARKLLDSLSEPFVVSGNKIGIKASIGIAIYPADGEDQKTLLINADKAMYDAKYDGGNNCQFYASGRFTNIPYTFLE